MPPGLEQYTYYTVTELIHFVGYGLPCLHPLGTDVPPALPPINDTCSLEVMNIFAARLIDLPVRSEYFLNPCEGALSAHRGEE